MIDNRKTFLIISSVFLFLLISIMAYLFIYLPNRKISSSSELEDRPVLSDDTENNIQNNPTEITDTHLEKEDDISNHPTSQKLLIDKISVNASIVEVGLNESRDIELPASDNDVGWYIYGKKPGDTGTAIIVGHGGTETNGVFSDIDQLVEGDIVSIINDNSSVIQYEVIKTIIYAQGDDTTEVFINNNGEYLNLVCKYDSSSDNIQTVQDRLVVFTKKI